MSDEQEEMNSVHSEGAIGVWFFAIQHIFFLLFLCAGGFINGMSLGRSMLFMIRAYSIRYVLGQSKMTSCAFALSCYVYTIQIVV